MSSQFVSPAWWAMAALMPLLVVPSRAFADELPAPPARAQSAPAPSAADRFYDDPAMTTRAAFTQPAGSWTYAGGLRTDANLGFSLYSAGDVFTHSLAHGLSDSVQATFTLQPLLTDNFFLRGSVGLKAGVRTSSRLTLSGEIGFGVVRRFGGLSSGDPWMKVPSATVFATACISVDCASNASANFGYALVNGGGGRTHVLNYGLDLLASLGSHVKVILGAQAASYKYGAGFQFAGGGFDKRDGFLLQYGIRLFASGVAADVGLGKPIGTTEDDIYLGLPYVAASYRWR